MMLFISQRENCIKKNNSVATILFARLWYVNIGKNKDDKIHRSEASKSEGRTNEQ